MHRIMRVLVSRAIRTDINVPNKCFADRFDVPDYDICDCMDKCKYDPPPPDLSTLAWVKNLPR